MEKVTYSFYAKEIDPTNQQPHEPTKYFWVRKFMTVEATEEQKQEMIKVLSNKEHPLFKMIHHAFNEIKLSPTRDGENFDDPLYSILETGRQTPYIKMTAKSNKGDNEDLNLMKYE